MNLRLACATLVLGSGLATAAVAGTVTENKALVADFIAAGNARDFERLPGLVTEDFTSHTQSAPGVVIESREQFVLHMRDDLADFPDARLEVRQVVAEGDRVAVWGGYLGTFRGDPAQGAILGRRIDVDFSAIFRIADDRIAEMWVVWDNQAARRQLTFRGIK